MGPRRYSAQGGANSPTHHDPLLFKEARNEILPSAAAIYLAGSSLFSMEWLWPANLAKRMECAQLAAAVQCSCAMGRWRDMHSAHPVQSGSKLRALPMLARHPSGFLISIRRVPQGQGRPGQAASPGNDDELEMDRPAFTDGQLDLRCQPAERQGIAAELV